MVDKNAFLFSLDKGEVYPYNGKENYTNDENRKYAIYRHIYCGPAFGGYIYITYMNNNRYLNYDNKFDIYISSNCIKEKSSYTYESKENSCYDFNKVNNALSEDGKKGCIYIADYEVFQVIFE